jgi:glycosyltransferase involved in cell wall biosynthesis
VKPLTLVTSGRWSGGGAALVHNLLWASARRPDLLKVPGDDDGTTFLVPRNVPPLRLIRAGGFILMPQNAWAWFEHPSGMREHVRHARLRLASELGFRRASSVIRVCSSIPHYANAQEGILPNVLDEEFETVASQTPVDTYDVAKSFVSIGPFAGYKNLRRLVRAFLAYRERGGVLGLTIVGEATNPRLLRALEAFRAVEPALRIVKGLVARRESVALVTGAHCAVFPSLVEASPTTPLEAGAMGTPAIVSDISGHRETLGTTYGELSYFDPTDDLALVSRLAEAERNREAFRPMNPLTRQVRELHRSQWLEALSCKLSCL